MIKNRTPLERLLTKITKTDTCWLWCGARWGRNRMYGQFRMNKHSIGAHRASYILHIGPSPEAKHLDHLCRNTLCVNPQHLEPVSCQTNLLRGIGIASINSKKQMCKNGHTLSLDNIAYSKKGGRNCRTCNIERAKLWRNNHKGYMSAYMKSYYTKENKRAYTHNPERNYKVTQRTQATNNQQHTIANH